MATGNSTEWRRPGRQGRHRPGRAGACPTRPASRASAPAATVKRGTMLRDAGRLIDAPCASASRISRPRPCPKPPPAPPPSISPASRSSCVPTARSARSSRRTRCCSPTWRSRGRRRAAGWPPCSGPTSIPSAPAPTCASACSDCARRSAASCSRAATSPACAPTSRSASIRPKREAGRTAARPRRAARAASSPNGWRWRARSAAASASAPSPTNRPGSKPPASWSRH